MFNTLSIVYYGEHLVGLLEQPLRQCIRLLREELGVTRVMLIPRWRLGPHLDLVLECSEERFAGEVFPRCRELFQAWLAANPSTQTIEPGAYLSLSEHLALAELEGGPFLPLLPNNTVMRGEYVPSRALKLDAIATAKEDFLCASLDLTMDLLAARNRDGESFFLTLVAMMVVLGETYRQGGVARGYLSYRSHAEYFFAVYDSPEQVLRKRFDALDQKMAGGSTALVRAILAGRWNDIGLDGQLTGLLRQWQEIAQATARTNDAIVADNYERLVADDTLDRLGSETATQISPELVTQLQQRAPSQVATAMLQEAGQRVLKSPEFLSYRTTVNFFYYLLPLLGVSPMKKFCLCLVTANAAERALGIAWEQILGIVNGEGAKRAS